MSGLSLETYTSNVKSIPLTILEQLVINAQKFRGHLTLAMPLFKKFLRGHVRNVSENMQVRVEVSSFNHKFVFARFGKWPLVWPDRYTKVKTLYPAVFTRSLGGYTKTATVIS